jgi:hypothetical protein
MSRHPCRQPRALGRRGPRGLAFRFILALAAPLAQGLVAPLSAQVSPAVYRVAGDAGGPVEERVALIERFRVDGTRVEISGGCWSSCTMFLSLAATCVTPTAQLGFHGPSSPTHGVALAPDRFEKYSRLMAAYYPEPLRSWFLREGRNITVGFTRFRGSDLIRMGIRAC